LKKRGHAVARSIEDRKVPMSISLDIKQIEKIDRTWKRRGYRSRSDYVLSLIVKDIKR
jgi:metal-responsive CopG/Arc/MetJ family transcriptional regulator